MVKKRGFSNIDEHVDNFIKEEISNSDDYVYWLKCAFDMERRNQITFS
jgi:hypothetical protein